MLNLFKKTNPFKDIDQAQVNDKPVKNLIIDNFFENQFLKDILDNFPEIKGNNDLRGNNNFFLLSELNSLGDTKRQFWNYFINNYLPIILRKLINKFSSQIIKKFENLILNQDEIILGTLMLSQNAQDERDFNAHYHYNIDPLWFLTILIYLEDENNNSPGTKFYTNKDLNNEEYINKLIDFNSVRTNKDIDYFDQRKQLDELLSNFNKTTIEFKPNRLFCFYDDFNAIHSVEYDNTSSVNRKIFRASIGFDRNKCELIYGLKIDDFNKIFNSTLKNKDKIYKIFSDEISMYSKKIDQSKDLINSINIKI